MQEEKLRLEDLLESSNSANDDDRINHVAIIGAGIMGQGIAQTVAGMGLEVTIVEVDAEKLRNCKSPTYRINRQRNKKMGNDKV